jgi:peptidoglycan/LPS O-acetylase OafA/YrhL
MSVKRIDNLTGVRALAALWVIVYHGRMIGHTGINLGPLPVRGYFGVDIFFVLSGFVLSLVYASRLPATITAAWQKKFLIRRLAKIYPVHFLTFLLSVALIMAARHGGYQFVSVTENTVRSAIFNVLLIHSIGLTQELSWNTVSWSVSAEWIAYLLLFAPIGFLLRGVKVAYVALATSGLWVALVAADRVFFHRDLDFTTYGALRIVPEFLAGYLLFRLLRNRKSSYGTAWALAGLAAIFLVPFGGSNWIVLMLPAILALLTGLYFGGRTVDAIFSSRFAVLIGEASYSMYLTHDFVLIAFTQAVHAAHVHLHAASLCGVLAAFIAVCIVVGWAMFRFVEEPLRQAILRRFGLLGRTPEASSSVHPPDVADTQVSATIG